MRAIVLCSIIATPLWAETPGLPAAPSEVVPTCTSCDARKAGLKKLKAARDAKQDTPESDDSDE